MKTSDYILASSMDKLAESIISQDGVANAAIREAGQRITDLSGKIHNLRCDLDAAITCIDEGNMDAVDAADYLRGVLASFPENSQDQS